MKTIRITTRQSRLALAQTAAIKQALLAVEPTLDIVIHPVITEGDRRLDVSLAKIGGKGLFTQALEEALLAGEVDIAVHSMKDIPAQLPKPFAMLSALPRLDSRDVFISQHYQSLQTLPAGAKVGTSSLRRALQLKLLYPDITIEPLRGNINTRLDKLQQGQYDAIILAMAGLKRLQLDHQVSEILPLSKMLPAIGQGSLAIEFCRDNSEIRSWLEQLCHQPTQYCSLAERAVAKYLDVDCHTPVAAHAEIDNNQISLTALVTNGDQILQKQMTADQEQAEILGQQMAQALITDGAKDILATLASE